MAVSFPATASDVTVVQGLATMAGAPPANTADGDVLVAVASTRTGAVTPPAGWTSVAPLFGVDGGAVVHVLPVPATGSLPGSWTWSAGSARSSLIIARVAGASLASPVSQAGTPGSGGTDSPNGLPLVLPGVTAGGGVLAFVFTYFTATAPPTAYVPGMTQLAVATTAGSNRSGTGLWGMTATGATGDVTCADTSTWASGAATGQSGVLVGIAAASAPAAPSGLLMTGII
jgi:hypothetical protein